MVLNRLYNEGNVILGSLNFNNYVLCIYEIDYYSKYCVLVSVIEFCFICFLLLDFNLL